MCFKEQYFIFKGTDSVSWQIIEKMETQHKPTFKLEFKFLNN